MDCWERPQDPGLGGESGGHSGGILKLRGESCENEAEPPRKTKRFPLSVNWAVVEPRGPRPHLEPHPVRGPGGQMRPPGP